MQASPMHENSRASMLAEQADLLVGRDEEGVQPELVKGRDDAACHHVRAPGKSLVQDNRPKQGAAAAGRAERIAEGGGEYVACNDLLLTPTSAL